MRLDRQTLDCSQRQLLSRGSPLKPAVWRVNSEGGSCIVKDVAVTPGWSRFLARWLMGRERRLLQKLHGLDGVPQILGEIDRDAFAMNLLPGAPLTGEDFAADPAGLAQCLRVRIDQVHQRGVFHLDLRQRQNILVSGPAEAHLVDFGAGLAPGPLGRMLWGRLLRWIDRQAVLKFLARHAPDELSVAEARSLLRGLRWRRFWIFSPHTDRGERANARSRIKCDDLDRPS
jgi:hypothetical protein